MSRSDDPIAGYLRPNERSIIELEGVVPGYTRWSGLGGIIGIVSALTVPRVLNLGFVLGALAIVAVITVFFMAVYYGIGRQLAKRCKPPTETPYLTVVLTDRRVLLFDRGLGGEDLKLIEETSTTNVSTVRYGAARPLVPQRLGYVVHGSDRREFEFARAQRVPDFVEHFS
jgi:hypothetical protein